MKAGRLFITTVYTVRYGWCRAAEAGIDKLLAPAAGVLFAILGIVLIRGKIDLYRLIHQETFDEE